MNTHIVKTLTILIAISFVSMIFLIPTEVYGKKGRETALQATAHPATAQGQIDFKLSPDPLWVPLEGKAEMTVTIGAAQSTDIVISLSSSAPEFVQVPPSVTIPANQTSRKFPVTGLALGSAAISATPPLSLSSRATTAIVSVRPRSVFNGLQYYPLPHPIRLLDTRPGASACDAPGAPLAGGVERIEPVRLTCGDVVIPSNAQAVVGNATVVNFRSGPGIVTLYPSDVTQPTVSNLNYLENQMIANAFTVGLGTDGAFKILATNTIDFIVDINGYYAAPGGGGLYYHPLPHPVRLLDTRPGQPACDIPGSPLAGNQTRTEPARIMCDALTIPANAQAVVGNATVVNSISSGGYITLYPSGAPRPAVSNLNFGANQIIPNAFTVGLGSDGAFNIFATNATHFIVDITGYYSQVQAADVNGAPGLVYNPLPRPVRLLDTRPGTTACTTPGAPIEGGQAIIQNTFVSCESIPIEAAARAVVGNATVVNSISDGGFITLWPNGTPQPTVSNLNFYSNQIIANAFTVGLSVNGQFNIFASAGAHFIVDLSGYFAP